ncbi:MAG: flagellar hook-associated protein FlgK [Nocardioidaceae bacterium]|nr:flagellar hook-associated protein FlgK [Nocardioidaceae bacterium]
MTGSFGGLSTALSALRHHQVAMDVASGNIANVDTPGYSRRRAVGETQGASVVPALWSRQSATGDGVTTASVDRISDPFLTARSRTENAYANQLQTTASSLARVEASMGEPRATALSGALDALSSAWSELASQPDEPAARLQVIAAGQAVAAGVNAQARAVASEWTGQRGSAVQLTADVNALATELAGVNRGLQSSVEGQGDPGLLDQRDLLTSRIAGLTGATVTHQGDGTATVTLGSATLVSGRTASTLAVSGAATIDGAATDPVSFTVGGTAVTVPSGSLGATAQLLNTGLPTHLAALDTVVAGLVSVTNTAHQGGNDLSGASGGAFFSGTSAATLSVAITDPAEVAAADPSKADPAVPGSGTFDGGNAAALAALDIASGYRTFVTAIGSQVSTTQRVATTQAGLAAQVDASREAVSGVNKDEELIDLVTSQRSYEAAARVLSTLDSVLDTLINRMAR